MKKEAESIVILFRTEFIRVEYKFTYHIIYCLNDPSLKCHGTYVACDGLFNMFTQLWIINCALYWAIPLVVFTSEQSHSFKMAYIYIKSICTFINLNVTNDAANIKHIHLRTQIHHFILRAINISKTTNNKVLITNTFLKLFWNNLPRHDLLCILSQQ